jgi:4-hydroxy-tetrahydrodipicolinate synthase
MKKIIHGIIPVMLTPFDQRGDIDWNGLENLVEWYIAHGAQALFAVCQSSEMQFLSLAERRELATFTVKQVAGRIPVLASGHIADNPSEQAREMAVIADTGIDCLVLVSNRLDPENAGGDHLRGAVDRLKAALPSGLPLGMYECPAPCRRLLTDAEILYLCDDPRFVFLKDVSCDLDVVRRRTRLANDSMLAVNNANAAIAHPALQSGADGFCGVFTNFHPDLYRWLQDEGPSHPELADELGIFLALAALSEPMGYPKLAKIYHQRLGTFKSTCSRTIDEDIRETFWALYAVIDKISEGTDIWRQRISDLG